MRLFETQDSSVLFKIIKDNFFFLNSIFS